MRRLHLALVLTALMAFCIAFSAHAAYANTESGYVTWTAGMPNDTPPLTPHKGYATTTQKCAVCHAVHKAPAAGQLLLRSTVGDSCTYCHVTSTISSKTVYDGSTLKYTTEDDHGHQSPAVTCVSCHAVHGANTFGGPRSAKILKVWGIQQTFVLYATNGSTDASAIINGIGPLDGNVLPSAWPGEWDTSDVQDAAFCTQCHPYYSDASETLVTADVMQSNGTTVTSSFKTHPLKKPGGEGGRAYYQGFSAQGSTVPTDQSVAVFSTRGCFWTCHKSVGYPHYNGNTSRFVNGRANAESADGTVAVSSDDGACLGCHVWGNRPQTNPGPVGGTGITH